MRSRVPAAAFACLAESPYEMTAPHRVRSGSLVCLCLALAAEWSLQHAAAQDVPEPAAVRNPADDLAIVLERGAQLEQQRRWAEALNHYEEALRKHPHRTDLSQRLQQARTHYDVCRRYADSTFTAMVDSLTGRDALAVYDEVLLKVNSHFVEEPNWQGLFQRGTAQLAVALVEQPFADKHLARLAPAERAALGKYVAQITAERKVTSRQQAIESVDFVARALAHYFKLSQQATVLEYVSGAAGSLDDYSGFLTGSQMDEVFTQIEGNFVGLGVELKTEDSALLIVNVIENGPAFEGGIRPGDRILAVEGRTTADPGVSPDSLADMLRGQEGTRVKLDLEHAGGQRQQIVVTRRRVEVPSVTEVKMLDAAAGVGYFKINSFQKTTPRDVDEALWELHGKGMRTLVVDLRGNPGGLLKAAVDVADKFVMDGMLVATRGRSPREDFDHRGQIAGTWRVPLVVLIDKDSASASEILAGAIQDHRRGTLVGERSYGKGSVQGIFPLNATSAGVRLTTAKWFTPSGQPISGRGVTPDLIVQVAGKPAIGEVKSESATPEDRILAAGLQSARATLAAKP